MQHFGPGQEMGRPKTDVRISLKGRNGRTVRVGLVRGIDGRWIIYRDGKRSAKIASASSTRIGDMIAAWLRGQAD